MKKMMMYLEQNKIMMYLGQNEDEILMKKMMVYLEQNEDGSTNEEDDDVPGVELRWEN